MQNEGRIVQMTRLVIWRTVNKCCNCDRRSSVPFETSGKTGFPLTAPRFLSGIILTFCTCPVVSNIWRSTSSVTLGSKPPTYSALLLGSGAARRTELFEEEPGDNMPARSPPPGEVIAVGIGLLFCGMTTGGKGGGGM